MKFTRSVVAMVILISVACLLQAQTVKPTSLTIDAVPGYTSPPQDVKFYNTGSTELTLTVSITGPFAIPKNRCGRGVKPQTHCDVWVTYTPLALGTDTGALTFTFNDQTVSVPLMGFGVGSITTTTKFRGIKDGSIVLKVSAEEGYIPDGGASAGCISADDLSGSASTTLVNGQAFIDTSTIRARAGGGESPWWCYLDYWGNAEFAASETVKKRMSF